LGRFSRKNEKNPNLGNWAIHKSGNSSRRQSRGSEYRSQLQQMVQDKEENILKQEDFLKAAEQLT
jgi:hypothetical protein